MSYDKFYYYRTLDNIEVDLIIENNRKLQAFEIKSSSTFSKDFTKSLNVFKKEYNDEIQSLNVIYTGDEAFDFKGINVLNFKNRTYKNKLTLY